MLGYVLSIEGLAACSDERLNCRGFIYFALLELAVDGEVKMSVDGLLALTIQDAQRAKLLSRLLGQPRKLARSLHEACYGLRNKNVLRGPSKNNFVEHPQMLVAEICWYELTSTDCWNV